VRFLIRDIDIFVEIAVDLVADLDNIAAVDEHGRLVLQHDRRTGRTAKACQPGQSLRIFADIFAHMLVTDRHDKPIKAVFLQLFPQRVEAGFVSGHQHR